RLIDHRFRLALAAAVVTAAFTVPAGVHVLSPRVAVQACVRDGARDETDRADRVVVAGDRVVDDVRIAVRVRDGHDGDADAAGGADGEESLRRQAAELRASV